ncbi:LacI family DNA-binding transcriptional regulator [Jannaschia sp. M317]|uniref:LacI family DNA-binding transcriptional regulator n=1 Tax=Jannaschia sp. M317 TaxID=2867011 RepID=UPI00288314D1|nr:LacI family DNA-binding transcriptional regulator [Jannaschia sp. M317]
MGKRVTSLDVARLAGVSQSAVSRVFSKGTSVSAAMDKRVRAAAEELGYRPNVLARSLITGRSRIIGFVVANMNNLFYADAVEKLSHALQAEGYHLLIFTMGESGIDLDQVVDQLMDYQVDGLIAASVTLSGNLVEKCAAAGLPIALFNRSIERPGLSAVTSDNRAGGRKVAEFLIETGHTRIAHVAGWQGASTGRDRLAGLRAGLEAAGQDLHALADGAYDREIACAAARDMMEAAVPPDALFVGNDDMALAVLDMLRFEMGVRVPHDVSVIGYDDIAMADWPAYRLTTVRQPVRRLVEATVAEILAQIEDPDRSARRIEIDGPLVVRDSCRHLQGYVQ